MFRSKDVTCFEAIIINLKFHVIDLSEYEDDILYYKKNGRYVVKPNNIPPIIPEIKVPKTLIGLWINRLLFIRYQKLINIVKTDIRDPNEKQ